MTAALFLSFLFLALLLQGVLEPYRLVTDAVDGPVPGLPESWRGAKVVVLADFQIGLWLDNRATTRRAVARAVAMRPALVLLAGDFVHDTARGIGPVAELLRPLAAAGIPAYAVLGNHDYGMPTERHKPDRELAGALARALREVGVRVLGNESVLLTNERGDTLYLVGLDSSLPTGNDRPERAFAAVPDGAPRIALMHHPDTYAKIPAHAAPLAFAGHTHGGQVRLPFAAGQSLLTRFRDGRRYDEDWAHRHGSPGNRLYVTRGVGCSVLPVRLNCPPEFTLLTLIRPEEAEGVPLSSAP